MAGIIFTGDNSAKRIDQSITRRLNAADGYRMFIDNSTTPSIADILPSGIITLPNVYVPGRSNLQVVVNGIIRPKVGASVVTDDYVELNNRQIELGDDIVTTLTNNPDSNIEIRWNRHWPGVRDAQFKDLQNITPDIEDAVLNADAPSGANPFLTGDTDDQSALNNANNPTAGNPLATIADLATGGSQVLWTIGYFNPIPSFGFYYQLLNFNLPAGSAVARFSFQVETTNIQTIGHSWGVLNVGANLYYGGNVSSPGPYYGFPNTLGQGVPGGLANPGGVPLGGDMKVCFDEGPYTLLILTRSGSNVIVWAYTTQAGKAVGTVEVFS